VTFTRLGVGGPSAAYPGFQSKAEVTPLDLGMTVVVSLQPIREVDALAPVRAVVALHIRSTEAIED
jgi:hypothetical protein